ncbi:hypothetical protein Tco_1081832, partial [Tanacetum coccineum]
SYPKSLTLEIHHGGCFTPIPSRSYVGGQVSSVNVVDIDEFCLHDLKDMVVKLGYGVADLMYYYFLIPRLGLDYGMHPLNVDADVLEMAKYVKDYKIILVYVEHGSSNVDTSIFVTPKKGLAIAVDNHLRKSVDDPFEDLDEILGDYANTRRQITGDEIIGKHMVVHVGNSSAVGDMLDLEMLFKTEGVGPIGKFKEVEVDADNESEEEMFDDDDHRVEDVHVSMNNFSFTADPKHDLSIGGVEVHEDDIDVINYDSFGSNLDDGIDSEKRIQLRELRRISKQKNKVETMRKLIMVKNDKERVRVRCEGTILALLPYVATDTDTGKNEFSQTKGCLVIRENIISGQQNILGKDKTVQGKGKRWEVRTLTKDRNCLQSREIKACTSRFLSDHIIKSLATNLDIPVRAVEDQIQKQFDVGISKMKAFRAKRIATNKMTSSSREQYSLSLTRTFRRMYVCLGALKQGFRVCGREILGLDGCFMLGPWPGQILTAVGVDANSRIYPVAYAIVEAESKGLIQAIASVFPSAEHMYYVRHIHENMKSQFKGGVHKEML